MNAQSLCMATTYILHAHCLFLTTTNNNNHRKDMKSENFCNLGERMGASDAGRGELGASHGKKHGTACHGWLEVVLRLHSPCNSRITKADFL